LPIRKSQRSEIGLVIRRPLIDADAAESVL
jgi:hypothetical protein